MDAYPGGPVGFGLVAMLTHAVIGYTLGAVLFDRPGAGAIGGVVADCDHVLEVLLGPPFVHRGVTHSALAVGVAAGLAVGGASRRDLRVSSAVGIGYLSHVLLDATTPMGVMLLYPVSTANVAVPLSGHSPRVASVIWVACAAVLLVRGRRAGTDADGVASPARRERAADGGRSAPERGDD